MDHAAKFIEKAAGDKIRCVLCPHCCLMSNNHIGICKVRFNKAGVGMTKIYGEVSSFSNDPIEKKPLYHFYPGSHIFSAGSWGCNFKCAFCQNWDISQRQAHTEHFEKERIVEMAAGEAAIGIAYTYNEPAIWYEFVYDTAKYAHEKGLKNVLVTNGFINEEPLKELLPFIDAMNVDLKGMSEVFYRKVCGAQLAPVLRSVKQAVAAGVHVELTNLVIPTLNDSADEINKIVDWVASISPEIPFHFSRYFPNYKMDIAPTDVAVIRRAWEIGKRKLKYVYMGNVVPEEGGHDTACFKCGKELIKRVFPRITISGIKHGCCVNCGEKIAGRFL